MRATGDNRRSTRNQNRALLIGALCVAAGILVLALGVASSSGAQAACPVAGQCGTDPQTHCPTDGPIQDVTPPDVCESIPAQLIVRVKNEPGGGCVQNEYIQVQVPSGVDEYEAVWYSSIGLGTRWWDQSDATVGPDAVTGEGDTYKVPVGDAAWSAAGGASAAGDCSGSPPSGTYGVAGWGVSASSCPLNDAGTASVQTAKTKKHCTQTKVKCPNGTDQTIETCFISVTDTAKHPVTPTGKVKLVLQPTGQSGSIDVTLDLGRTPANSPRTAVVPTDDSIFVLDVGGWTATAHYLGDANHKTSTDGPKTFSITGDPSLFLGLKQNLKNLAAALAFAGTLVIVPEAGAAKAAVAGYYLLVSGAGLNYLVTVFGDPPDQSYRSVAVPDFRSIMALPAGTSPLTRAARALMADGLRLEALGKVLHKTIDRAVTAEKAHNRAASKRQIRAASTYLKSMSEHVKQLIPDEAKIAQVLTQEGLGTNSTPLSTLQANQAKLAKNLPPAALKLFHRENLSGKQIAWIRHMIAAARLQSPEDVAGAFTNPALIASERRLAAAFRKLANNPLLRIYPGGPRVG
jgi:hypothetical protein